MTKPMGDWYAELRLRPDASTNEIAQAVEKRSHQATALANTSPERSQQLREQVRAMKRDLLSGDDARQRYDAARVSHTAQLPGPPAGLGGAPDWPPPPWYVGPGSPPPSAPPQYGPGPVPAGNSIGRVGDGPPPFSPPGSGPYPPGAGGPQPSHRQPLPAAWMAAIACVVVAAAVVAVLIVLKMRSDSQNAQGTIDPPTNASDTSSSNTGTPSSSASTSQSVSSSSPAPAPTPSPTVSPGATPVAFGPAVPRGTRSNQVALLFSNYLTAINEHDYHAFRATFSHPVQSQSEFESNFRTTVDSSATLTNVEIGSDGRPVATLRFTSHQAPGLGPKRDPSQTCSIYRLPLLLDHSSRGYLIDDVVGSHPPQACGHG